MRRNYRHLIVKKNASGAEVADARDIKEDSEIAAAYQHRIYKGLSGSSHNCYFRD